MAQIITSKPQADRCNLSAIRSGGSKASYVLNNNEIWLVDTTNSNKGTDGWGRFDSYIVGDGATMASELPLYKVDDIPSADELKDFVTVAYMTDGSTEIETGNEGDLWIDGNKLKVCTVASTATTPAVYVVTSANSNKIYAYTNILYRYYNNSFAQLGEQGPAGPVGPEGPKGPKGNDGIALDYEDVTIMQEESDIEGKTDEEKEKMLASGVVVKNLIDDIYNSVNDVTTEVITQDVTSEVTFTQGKAVKQGGELHTDSNKAYSDFIAIPRNTKSVTITIPRWQGTASENDGMAFYNANSEYSTTNCLGGKTTTYSGYAKNLQVNRYTVNIPTGATHIAVTWWSDEAIEYGESQGNEVEMPFSCVFNVYKDESKFASKEVSKNVDNLTQFVNDNVYHATTELGHTQNSSSGGATLDASSGTLLAYTGANPTLRKWLAIALPSSVQTGDIIIVSTSNRTDYSVLHSAAFFHKEVVEEVLQDVAIGDAFIEGSLFQHSTPTGDTAYKKFYLVVPENATHICLANYYQSTSKPAYTYAYLSEDVNDRFLATNTKVTEVENQYNETVHLVKQAHYKDVANSSTIEGRVPVPVLGLLHYSDVHGDPNAFTQVKYFKELLSSYIDDVINTGDIVRYGLESYSDSVITQYFTAGMADFSLFTLGNHDLNVVNESTQNKYWYWTNVNNADGTNQEAAHLFGYNRYFVGKIHSTDPVPDTKFYEKWNVTMPTGHNVEGSPYENACFWHKDYADQKVRVIGLDAVFRFDGILEKDSQGNFVVDEETHMLVKESDGCAHNTTEQETWLKNLLDETLTQGNTVNGWSVVFLSHYPLDDFDGPNELVDRSNVSPDGGIILDHKTNYAVNFSDYKTSGLALGGGLSMHNRISVQDDGTFSEGSVNNMGDIIQNWKDRGGKYVAWICGHKHSDIFYYPKKYPELLTVSIEQAGSYRTHTDADRTGADNLCANYYAIDTHNGYFKIVRLGLTTDRTLAVKKALCYNYLSKTVVVDN